MTLVLFLGVLIGLIGSAFYSGLETGIVSVNPLRLNHMVRKKIRNADILKEFIDDPDHLLGTTLVGNNLCNVIASIAAVSLGTLLAGQIGYSIAYVSITALMLILGEYIPKAWFQSHPAHRVMPFVRFLKYNGIIYSPVSKFVTAITRVLMPLPKMTEEKVTPILTREELHHLTEESHQAGSLSPNESALMKRVFHLTSLTCKDLMMPIDEAITITTESSAEKIIELSREKDHSRLPVWSPDQERYTGIVYIFDVLSDPQFESKTARDYLRAPQFTGEQTRVEELLPRMRRSRQPMALVTNSSAEVIGVLTTEDILKHIVGPL